MDRINFANKIITDYVRTKGEKFHSCELVQWGKR